MTSIGIGEASVLHEADYIFKDFTETFLFDLRFLERFCFLDDLKPFT